MTKVLRLLVPSLVILILLALLVFTIFYTIFDWQWIAFLSGILFAAVLSLVSASWKSEWRLARRALQARRFKELLDSERKEHRRVLLELEHLAHDAEALRAMSGKEQAERVLLAVLARELKEAVFLVDREFRCQYHTLGFAKWVQAQSEAIDGHLFDEQLRLRTAASLRPLLHAALTGKPGRVELDDGPLDASGKRYSATATPCFGLPRQVTGALVIISEDAGARPAAPGDERQGDVYVTSLTDELTGWENPHARIREAIERDEFQLYVQDIVALLGSMVPGRMHELLIRMHDEEKSLLPPGAFLPIAVRCGLMPDLDRHVVAKALRARQPALASGTASLPVLCINLSRATFEDRSFAPYVAKSLAESRASAESLCFEFEDSDVRGAIAEASRLAGELKALGCRLSLDGFGASGVAFDQLRAVPVDFLKIDGHIIFELARDPVAVAKVNAIQRVCKNIGVRTIAELVESDGTLAMLRQLGVDYAQGFGVDRPRPFPAGIGIPAGPQMGG